MKSTASTRTKALQIVLQFAGVKGSAWNLKTGGELIAEAAIVDRWILTGETHEHKKADKTEGDQGPGKPRPRRR